MTMKTRTSLLIIAIGLVVNLYGQKTTIELSFTATDAGLYVPLDSILVENITQGGDTTLYFPDTLLVLDYVTSIWDNREIEENNFIVSQNYPNPFKSKTEVILNLPEKDDIKLTIQDILGRKLVDYKNSLDQGVHSFIFYAGNEKYYLLTVTGKKKRKTIKMLNAKGIRINGGKCRIVYKEYKNNVIGFKSHKAINNFIFNIGDDLQFTGYGNTIHGIFGSAVIKDSPNTTTNYGFTIQSGLRCPETPTVADIDGNIYNSVLIGNQCWMKENLATTSYQNGTPIPNVTNDDDWEILTTGAYAWYENDINWKESYGALYNWYTVTDENELCPSGWHIPTKDEWYDLTGFSGGPLEGDVLKSCRMANSQLGIPCETSSHPRWEFVGGGVYATDDFGLSGLPGGMRYYYAPFGHIGIRAYWWASTENTSSKAWFFNLNYWGSVAVVNQNGTKQNGYSVRCIRD